MFNLALNHGQHISGVNEVIPLQCLREISRDLPVSTASLARIEYRVRNYQQLILGVTKEFQKLEHLSVDAKFEYLPHWPYGRSRCCALALVFIRSPSSLTLYLPFRY